MRFRFWSEQPVFHIYDLSYYLFYSGVIQKDLPEKTRYTNFKDVETLTFGKNVGPLVLKRFIDVIKHHYLQNDGNVFSPKEENIIPYFEGHNSPCFLSLYKEPLLLQDAKSGSTIEREKIIGVITSRPLHVTIRRLKKGTGERFDAYYVDYLCVDKMHRKKGIAPQLIATHKYNERLLNRNIQVSIFKREGALTGIVPICVFGMYVFSMRKWNKPLSLLPPYSVVECGSSNMHHFYDFLQSDSVKKKIDLQIMPETTNLMSLMKTKNIYVYLLLEQGVGVVGCYFFKRSCTQIEKGKEAVICFASVNGSQNNIFSHGFKQTVSDICLKKEVEFHYTVVEEICDNDIIVENLKLKTWPQTTIPGAYFFYNYVFHTIPAKKFLIIN